MTSPFVHLEVLGPRASLDAWLAALQSFGGAHVVDALVGLEGEAGIGRPHPTEAEQRAVLRRSEAARVLRAVERVLPPSSAHDASALDRPSFAVGAGGEGERDLETIVLEAQSVGARIREALERARAAEHAVDVIEGERLALEALERAGESVVGGWAWRLPADAIRPRRVVRALEGAGFRAGVVEGPRETVVVAVGGEADALPGAEVLGAAADQPLEPAADLEGRPLSEARTVLAARREPARLAYEESVAALRRQIEDDGGRARLLLDALEDSETRAALWRHLAATQHVVAARVYVRGEDRVALERVLDGRFGAEVIVRERAGVGDAPALPRAVAGLPFAAFDGLRPSRFGEVSTASVLALITPLAAGAVLADVGAGLLFLLVGAAVGLRAAVGSPRRDTALMAQLAGFVCLCLGVVEGRAFGAAGSLYFGTDWGLYPGGALLADTDVLGALLVRLGGTSFVLALWGGVSVLVNLKAGRPTRAQGAGAGALAFAVLAGTATLALPAGHELRGLWILAPIAAGLSILLFGLRIGAGRLLLDLVGVFRLVAVSALAILLIERGFGALADPSWLHLVMAPALLLVSTLALVVDPAHVAMGVPYDLSLGARGMAAPFAPLARHTVGAPGSRRLS